MEANAMYTYLFRDGI